MLRLVIPPYEWVPLMGMVTGVIAMVIIGTVIIRVAQSSIGQAIARRLHGRSGALEEEFRSELDELREHVADLQHRLAESEERLDFTERLLTRGKDTERLADGGVLDNRH